MKFPRVDLQQSHSRLSEFSIILRERQKNVISLIIRMFRCSAACLYVPGSFLYRRISRIFDCWHHLHSIFSSTRLNESGTHTLINTNERDSHERRCEVTKKNNLREITRQTWRLTCSARHFAACFLIATFTFSCQTLLLQRCWNGRFNQVQGLINTNSPHPPPPVHPPPITYAQCLPVTPKTNSFYPH